VRRGIRATARATELSLSDGLIEPPFALASCGFS
jgi:hypothetical protein